MFLRKQKQMHVDFESRYLIRATLREVSRGADGQFVLSHHAILKENLNYFQDYDHGQTQINDVGKTKQEDSAAKRSLVARCPAPLLS